MLRVIANLSVLFLLCVSASAVIWVVERSSEQKETWWRRNEITVVMTLISFIFPMLFELLGLMEYYHPRMQLRLQLARIMILNLLNLYSLIWALFGKIKDMREKLKVIRSSQKKTLASTSMNTEPTTPLPASTMNSATNDMFSRITEILYQTPTEQTPDPITESYDYSNTNYFEYEEPETKMSTTFETSSVEPLFNFTEAFIDFTDAFYLDNDFGNITDFYSNSSGDLFENSNFNLSNLLNFAEYNASSVNGTGFNLTDILPLSSVYQNFQYSYLQQEHPSFVNQDLLNASSKLELRKLCWETMFGQELVKLTVMDLVTNLKHFPRFSHDNCLISAPYSYANIDSRFFPGTFRSVHEFMLVLGFRETFSKGKINKFCEPFDDQYFTLQYGDFKIAENILHLVNNQGMVWMGMFFSPGLAILNLIKLVLILYLRSWAVLTCNVPHEVVFR